jgi:hypothetical protein
MFLKAQAAQWKKVALPAQHNLLDKGFLDKR